MRGSTPGSSQAPEIVRTPRPGPKASYKRDFVPEDLILLLMTNAGADTKDRAHEAWRRFATLMIEAFRADRARDNTPLQDGCSERRSVSLAPDSHRTDPSALPTQRRACPT